MQKHEKSGLLGKELQKALDAGGKVIFARVVQHDSGQWFVNIIGDWTDGEEMSLWLYDRMRVRLFKRLGTCLTTVFQKLNYGGPLTVWQADGMHRKTVI